nr:MAG TPA: hypothetical protein [Caudoviricetes sp.]
MLSCGSPRTRSTAAFSPGNGLPVTAFLRF